MRRVLLRLEEVAGAEVTVALLRRRSRCWPPGSSRCTVDCGRVFGDDDLATDLGERAADLADHEVTGDEADAGVSRVEREGAGGGDVEPVELPRCHDFSLESRDACVRNYTHLGTCRVNYCYTEAMDVFDDPRITAMGLLAETYLGLMSRLSCQVAEHGLSSIEFEVLLRLGRSPQGQLRMTDLSAQTSLTASGVTRVVDRLERDGLRRTHRVPDRPSKPLHRDHRVRPRAARRHPARPRRT